MNNEIKIYHKNRLDIKEFRLLKIVLIISSFTSILGLLFSNSLFINTGLSLIVCFCFLLFMNAKSNQLPLLIINQQGIIDIQYGLIIWNDIKKIRISEHNKAIILIDVHNENTYIENLKVGSRFGPSYKKQLKRNAFGYNTAVILYIKSLKYSRDTIVKILEQELKKQTQS